MEKPLLFMEKNLKWMNFTEKLNHSVNVGKYITKVI